MKWESLLQVIANEPLFTTGLLLTAGRERADVEKQLSRWRRAGKLIQLRRGLYGLAPPWRKLPPHPFLAAGRVRPPSYVSLQSALAYYGLIPEAAAAVTSVTTGRPGQVSTPLGRFIYLHLAGPQFFGYQEVALGEGQAAFLALPEKALLDLVYLTPHGDDPAWLGELRLQNLDQLDGARLEALARASGSAKLLRAVEPILRLTRAEEYQDL